MSPEVIATILSAIGVLIGVWKMVDGTRRELSAKIDSEIETVNHRIDGVNRRIETVNHRIDGVNQRIDAVLLADRR